jgi:signal transduction histidine kinase
MASATSVDLIMHSQHLADRDIWAAYTLATAWPLIGTGILWWWLRPASGYGTILVAAGFLPYLYGLLGDDDPLVYFCGVLAETIAVLGLVHLVLCFPTGRLGKIELMLALGIGMVLLLGRSVLMLRENDVVPLSPLAACRSACPADLLQLGPSPLPGWLGSELEHYWRFGVGFLAAAAIASRVLLARSPRRRLLTPPCALAALWAASLAGYGMALLAGLPTGAFVWAVAASGFLLPYGFFASLIAARASAIRAITRIVGELNAGASVVQLQTTMRRLFGDSGLRLAFQLSDALSFIDVEGFPIGPRDARPDQHWTQLAGSNRPAAAVIHDSMLGEDPEFLNAAAGATRLVVEHSRLDVELLRSSAELRRARRRMVEAEDIARRALERDLHDSAQQQLVAARIGLVRAREQARDRLVKSQIGEVERLLGTLQEELRDISHGLEPLVLRRRGLAAALRVVSLRIPQTVVINSRAIQRHDDEVESAVYYCCIEALHNALKHGGRGVMGYGAMVRIQLWEADDRLHFEVHDSGAGFEMSSIRSAEGLARMVDRIGAQGGTLKVSSSVGEGTVVSGWVPTHPAS